jgi:hypothetical protein
MAEFIECESLSISYSIAGIATVNYTILSTGTGASPYSSINAGNQNFAGVITNVYTQMIEGTEGADPPWYETHVTLIATT